MATPKKTQIVITANAAVAKKVMEELAQRTEAIKQKMAGLDVTTKQGQKEFNKLKKELVSYNSAISQNVSNTERIDKAMKNLAGTSLNELKRALSAAKSELGKMSSSSSGLKQMQGNVRSLQTQIDKLTGSVHKQSGAWSTALKNLGAYAGLFQVFNQIKSVVTSALKKNFDYSASLTDIRKVSGLTMADVNKLSEELAKIDTRTSVDGLAQLAYQGAKLGMGKYGVDGMKQFVAAADQINVAIGEEMGEQALPALSKLVETMGLIPKMGIEKAMLATGSAMFKLSSTSTATSNNIVEFAKRLTGVSRTAGITTDQLLALGSASDSLFLMPEVSATAMSKFIVALQKNHNLIEKDLGIEPGTISNLYSAGHAMDAIVMVLEKMRDKGNMNALGGIFKDLGSDGQRLVTAMVTMSKNVDVLKDHLQESKEAFQEATAVTNEYEMQQQSAAGILERANNLWEKAFVNPDGVDNVKSLAKAWYSMSQTILQSPLFNGMLTASIWAVITACKVLVYLLPSVISYFASLGVIKTVKFFWDLGKAIKAATLAQSAFNVVSKANPYALIASAVITAVGVIWSFVNASKKAAEAAEEAERKANAWRDTLGKAAVETSNLTKKLANYKKMLEETSLSQDERTNIMSRFNKDFRQYISNLGIEIKSVKDLRNHYSELSREIQRATYYRMRENAKEQALPAYRENRVAASNELMKRVKEANLDFLGVTFDDIDRWVSKGASGNSVYEYLVKKLPSLKTGVLGDVKYKVDSDGRLFTTNRYGRKLYASYRNDALLSAARWYVNSTRREKGKEAEIDKAYGNFVPEGYTPYPDDVPGTLENDAPDKDAIAAAKREKREREKAWRDELKKRQDEANAIMDNVRNFYERQVNQKLSDAVSLGMDKTEQDLLVEPVKRRMNEALKQVRLAIAGQRNTWEDFKKTMDKDLIEKTDETGVNLSKGLLNSIQENNIDALHDLIARLEGQLGLSKGSAIAQVFAKATKNEQANLKLEAQQKEVRRKIAQENDYVGVVKQNMYDDFNTMGYANPTETEVVSQEAFVKRKKNIIDMFETARTGIAQLYTIDPSTKDGQGALMKMLFGDDPDGMGLRVSSVLGNNAVDWQVFYHKLVQYSDEYTEAQKKTYDQQKKITDQMWAVNRRNLANQDRLRKMQNESNLFGKRTNLLSNLGLADLTADPEVELMKARMQAAEDYYAFVERNSKNQQLVNEAERARQEAELNYANQMATAMKNRLAQMKELVQPITDFGAAVGNALAEMKNDSESANEAIKNALKSMLQSWGQMALNDVNTQMWKAINDAGAKKGRADAQPGIQTARDNATANVIMPDLTNIGTEQNPVWVRIAGDHYENANGDHVGAPRAWRKRNGYSTEDDRDGFAEYAGQVGAEAAGVAIGGGSAADVGASVAASGMGAALNAPIGGLRKESKEKSKQLKDEKEHQREMTKEVKKGSKDREKESEKGVKNITQASEDANKEQTKSEQVKQDTISAISNTAMTMNLKAKQDNDAEVVEQSKDTAKVENTFSIVGAIGKCFEYLGPIAGPIAAASVMAILTGLMNWGLSAAFGSKNKKSASGKNAKVVSGMLTYDSGNVQDLKPFVSDNGEVYWAEDKGSVPQNGVSLLTRPTATTINGQRSLVAERGPELVIGRETTRAMMMDNPSLLKALVNYDRNYSGRNAARRAFEEGNVADVASNLAPGALAAGAVAADSNATNAALLQAVTALLRRLDEPISAKIDMYGRGNLYDSMTQAARFMKGKS